MNMKKKATVLAAMLSASCAVQAKFIDGASNNLVSTSIGVGKIATFGDNVVFWQRVDSQANDITPYDRAVIQVAGSCAQDESGGLPYVDLQTVTYRKNDKGVLAESDFTKKPSTEKVAEAGTIIYENILIACTLSGVTTPEEAVSMMPSMPDREMVSGLTEQIPIDEDSGDDELLIERISAAIADGDDISKGVMQ